MLGKRNTSSRIGCASEEQSEGEPVQRQSRKSKNAKIKSLFKKCRDLYTQCHIHVALVLFDENNKTITEYSSSHRHDLMHF